MSKDESELGELLIESPLHYHPSGSADPAPSQNGIRLMLAADHEQRINIRMVICDGRRVTHQSEVPRRVACMSKVRLSQDSADRSPRYRGIMLTGEQVPSEKAKGNDHSAHRVLSH